jgi:peptidoglycan/LPS O-acetylase OafA/YrhL
LRIFPLYYAVLFAVIILPPLVWAGVRQSELYEATARYGPWLWTYTSNVPLAIHNHWGVSGTTLGHFWTLAVEEQFYLLWPAVVWLCPNRRFRQLCIAVIVMSMALRYGLRLIDKPLANYVLMPARADALAIGAWLAATVRSGVPFGQLQRAAWFVLPASALGVAILFLRKHPLGESVADVQLIGYSLLALGFAATIVLALDGDCGGTVVGRIFRHPALRFLGKYSYAMYCVHPILQQVLKHIPPRLTVHTFPQVGGSVLPGVFLYGAISFAMTTAIAIASWHLLEKHFLRLKRLVAN